MSSSAAEQAAAVFAANGTMWQERPVKPPPYVPTADQIENVLADLLGKVIAGNAADRTNQHALFRNLRVVRLTKPTDSDQRFALQVQTQPAGQLPDFQLLAIVDAAGKPAAWSPPPPPEPETKDALRSKVAELQAQLEQLGASIAEVK